MSVIVSSLIDDLRRSKCLDKFKLGEWKGYDMMFVTYDHKAYSHNGVHWSDVVDSSDLVYVGVGGVNGPKILLSKNGNKNNYCGVDTFLDKN